MGLYPGGLITGMKNLFQIWWAYNRGRTITGILRYIFCIFYNILIFFYIFYIFFYFVVNLIFTVSFLKIFSKLKNVLLSTLNMFLRKPSSASLFHFLWHWFTTLSYKSLWFWKVTVCKTPTSLKIKTEFWQRTYEVIMKETFP